MKLIVVIIVALLTSFNGQTQVLKKPIPDKLVVLSFDDGPESHASFVPPILKKYGFGATFFVCEFPPDFDDKSKYMSWEQMQQLDKMGFEVANHTWHHVNVKKIEKSKFLEELQYVENKCKELGMKTPLVSFAYPGYGTNPAVLPYLKEKGYLFARTGGDRAYDPLTDHPYLLPSFTMKDSNKAEIRHSFSLAKDGKVLILTIHGVPDLPHPWVSTHPALFEEFMKYLFENHFKVIAMRDLVEYVDVEKAMQIKPTF